MIRIGITGQAGFMGSHLYNFLGLKEDIKRIPFKDDYFNDAVKLDEFVMQCDVIVHLAAMNRHGDPQVIYDTNIRLVKDLLSSCDRTNSKPHIIFSSSTQEQKDNPYGRSKKEGRELLENWAMKNDAAFTGMVIPNVFGPSGNPFYNSVIATFSYQLTRNEEPRIEIDGSLKLIYINELVEEFWRVIKDKSPAERDQPLAEQREEDKRQKSKDKSQKEKGKSIETYEVPHTYEIKVSDILSLLRKYKELYFEKGVIPAFNNKFEMDLFNTFRCYLPEEKFPFYLKENTDDRGSFVEIIRTNTSGQYSYSTTKPGITRGNHFHTRKIERFAIIKGKAKIELRKIGTAEVISYILDGKNPSFVDMPVWTTHNITNIGDEDLITLFWINELYNPDDPDTYFEIVGGARVR